MAGMSVSTGLVSGIDYDTMISQLMQVEANPQTLLKQQLSSTQSNAAAYRAVNTRFDALRSAAAALQADTAWGATKASSTSSTVTATSSATAAPGSTVSFSVAQVAATHVEVSSREWGSKTAPVRDQEPIWPITVTNKVTKVATQIDVPADATLTDAATAINAANAGVKASVIQVSKDKFRLQLTSTASGEAGGFTVTSSPRTDGTAADGFLTTSPGQDAILSIGGGLKAYSATNTFADLLPGVTITATKADPATTVTVSVAADTDSTAAKVQSLVDAANGLFDSIKAYTDKDSASASLKGDTTLRGLATQMLGIISSGVGGVSASTIGIQLTKTGSFTFDKAAFTAKLASDPAGVKDLLNKKTVTSPGLDGETGTADDVGTPVGFAAQLEALGKRASDATTGTLTMLATSSDSLAKDLTARIADWDTRLAIRKDTITRQFTAMETALGTLQNQGAWLSSQIAGLPSWSKSN